MQVSRPQVIKKLYAYIKANNLQVDLLLYYPRIKNKMPQCQDPENNANFTPDKVMQPVFGSNKQRHFGMIKHCKDHLTDPKAKK